MTFSIEEIKKEIKDFKLNINFPDLKVPEEINEILSLSRASLKSRSSEELSIDSIRLSQYALYIKAEINRMKSNMAWCNANVDSVIGRELQNVRGSNFYKEKELIIKRNDPDAKRYEGIKSLCLSKLKIIEEIDLKIEFMSNCLKGLIYSRGR